MMTRIKNFFRNLFKRDFDWKKHFPDSKRIIEKAFEVGGVQYYRFADIFNIPYERGLYSLAVYEETRMSCDREYLQKHVEAMKALLNPENKKIDIYKINTLNEQLGERMKMSFDVDLLYKLASVVFFDKKENPALYDLEYCTKKIEHWKKHKGVADFFLQHPLRDLMPYLDTVGVDLDTYSQLNASLNKIHLERLSM